MVPYILAGPVNEFCSIGIPLCNNQSYPNVVRSFGCSIEKPYRNKSFCQGADLVNLPPNFYHLSFKYFSEIFPVLVMQPNMLEIATGSVISCTDCSLHLGKTRLGSTFSYVSCSFVHSDTRRQRSLE